MKNRLIHQIHVAKQRNAKLFCAYLTLGYPTLARTCKLMHTLEKAGTDILELGFPFSDPLADGPTIQHASEQAIRHGVRLRDAFGVVLKLRREGLKIPVLFFSYFNPIFQYGVKKMARDLSRNGFDGAIIPDLPPEEGGDVERSFKRMNISLTYLVAPTTVAKRKRMIGRRSSGFIYYVSLRGVTGARRALPTDVAHQLKELRAVTRKPVLVGFGVSEPAQARALSKISDGVIVGSAIMDRLRRGGSSNAAIGAYISKLVRAMNV